MGFFFKGSPLAVGKGEGQVIRPTKRDSGIEQERGAKSLEVLLERLAGRAPAARERARQAVVRLGKPAVPALIPLLSAPRPHVRWEAAKALDEIADPIAATALVNSLEDPDPDVRWVAAEGLTRLGRQGLQPLLTGLLEKAQSLWFSQGAHHVCHVLIQKRKKLAPILRPVLKALEETEPALAVPPAAYTALSQLRAER